MEKYEFRKLGILDLKLILEMEGDFRENFIIEENTRQVLLNSDN